MLPIFHFIFSVAFALLFLGVFPETHLFYIFLIFFAAYFIDFDHYAAYAIKRRDFSLPNAIRYYKKMLIQEKRENARGIRKKGDFHLFHTIEFHILVALMGFIWAGFFYIFLGMLFHSILDIILMTYNDRLYRRYFFFFDWLVSK